MKITSTLLAIGFATSLYLSEWTLAAPSTPASSVTSEPVFMKMASSTDSNGKSVTAQAQANAPKPILMDNPLWSIPLSKLSETRERPLFTPSRLPPPPMVVPPADNALPLTPVKQTAPQLALVGTVVSNAEGFGLFIETTTKAIIRLKTGGEYQGWVLRSVGKREVILKKNDFSATLSLSHQDL